MFGNVLKTNSNLYFAVLTGCLRIAKESIFTGLNNFEVLSVLDVQYDEYFGFTDTEVQDMLNYYDLSGHYTEVKEWYDGYQFGNTEVYCPWDVICYCKKLYADPNTKPEDYWSNTSGNAIVRRFINRADSQTKNDIERLIAGETVTKEIHQELTYNELDSSIENLWNVLFTTGYLTQKGKTAENQFRLKIPNLGVKNLFIKQIREWFRQTSRQDGDTLNQFCNAFSETESGTGYSDILIEIPESRTGIVIEVKYAENGKMKDACIKALSQIEERKYAAKLEDDGMRSVIKYGIACYKKDCRVVIGTS